MEKLLPVGSVLYLQEGTMPLVITGVAQFVENPEIKNEKLTYFDYAGSIYPQGAMAGNTFYFNQDSVAKVLFTGYESEQHDRYLDAVAEWKEKNADTFILGKVE